MIFKRKVYDKLLEWKELSTGGMPQAVEAYVQWKTFAQIDFIKRNILALYEEDLVKYDKENQEHASVIYKTNARYQAYVDAVKFITDSMIGNECVNVTVPEVVPESYADRSNFKLYMGDTGLLMSQIMKSQDETDENLYKVLIRPDTVPSGLYDHDAVKIWFLNIHEYCNVSS